MPDYLRFDTQESAVIGASVAEDDACRLMYITEGDGKMAVGGKTISFFERDIFVLPPGTRLETSSASGYRRIMLRITGFDAAGRFDSVVRVRDNPTHDVHSLLMMLYRECVVDSPSHSDYISRLTQLIFTLVSTISIHETSRPYVEQIENLLAHNVSNASFELDSIYGAAPDLSKDYVRRIFKQKTGCTPNVYLNRLRIEKAKELLDGTGEYNVKQTAAACGFNDQYYFSRMFKKQTGISPARWKRQSK